MNNANTNPTSEPAEHCIILDADRATVEPFCACGRRISQCDRSRRGCIKRFGNLIPASGGTEEPFIARNGRRLLYVVDTTTITHHYLDLDNDTVLSDAEAEAL